MRIGNEATAEGGAVVTAGGRLTASGADRLQRALLEAFACSGPVRLVLRGVEEADMTLLQLVCAAQRTAAERGVAFALEGVREEPELLRLIREAGAERGAGCEGECAWAGVFPAADTPTAGGAD